jgi:hypothetical protein
MKDVFGTGHNQITLTAYYKGDADIIKKDKNMKTNLVKIYLAAVPSLEETKDALVEISEGVSDATTKAKIDEFITSILKITEEILDLTKVAVRGVRAEASQENAAETTRPSITPGMINGTEEVPKA